MGPIEIITIIVAVLIVAGTLTGYFVRKAKGKNTGGCAGCPYAKDCKHGACQSHNLDLSTYKSDDTDQKI